MRARYIPALIVLLTVSFGQPTASRAASALDFSGFGTLGYVISDSEDSEYRTGKAIDGADDSGSFKVDSRLGIQFDKGLTDTTSATLQLLSRQSYDGDFTPEVEWAFLKTQLNDSFSLRLGRIGTPFFMVSDFREVGYANPTLRPPEDTYVQAPLGSFDGLDITGYHEIGDTLISAQALVGMRKQDFYDDATIDLKDGIGGNIAFERGIARLRFSYIQVRIKTRSESFDALGNALGPAAAFVPELTEVAEDFNGRSKASVFAGVGLELDMAPWFVAAEYTQRRIKKTFISSNDAWYITAGYRWKSLTPYLTFSGLTQVSKTEVNLPPIPQLEPLREPLVSNYAAGDQDTIALGLRWDFHGSAAFKVQVENISRESRGASFTRGGDSDIENPDDVRLFSLALDFTF